MSPYHRRDHTECRKVICCICRKKANRQLGDMSKAFIQKYLCSKYFDIEDNLPNGLCIKCSIKMSKYMKEESPVGAKALYDMKEFAKVISARAPITRTNPFCICAICNAARKNAATVKSKVKKPPSEIETQPSIKQITVCKDCFSQCSKGKKHDCTKSQKVQNIEAVISPKSHASIASKFIRKEIEQQEH